MTALVLYALITSSMFYLGSRAKITSWLWSRYPPKLAAFMDCPACTGFWYGLFTTLMIDRCEGIIPFGLTNSSIVDAIIVGFTSIVFTPIAAACMQAALDRLGTVIPDDQPPTM